MLRTKSVSLMLMKMLVQIDIFGMIDITAIKNIKI